MSASKKHASLVCNAFKPRFSGRARRNNLAVVCKASRSSTNITGEIIWRNVPRRCGEGYVRDCVIAENRRTIVRRKCRVTSRRKHIFVHRAPAWRFLGTNGKETETANPQLPCLFETEEKRVCRDVPLPRLFPLSFLRFSSLASGWKRRRNNYASLMRPDFCKGHQYGINRTRRCRILLRQRGFVESTLGHRVNLRT